jgi:hypothetical protein
MTRRADPAQLSERDRPRILNPYRVATHPDRLARGFGHIETAPAIGTGGIA